jgi:beta-glucanase (GH16 family)
MYMNDTQETDIEIRTGDPTHIHFTNQQTHPSIGETTYAVPAPATMTSAFHEYRYDWLPTGTNFYIDVNKQERSQHRRLADVELVV